MKTPFKAKREIHDLRLLLEKGFGSVKHQCRCEFRNECLYSSVAMQGGSSILDSRGPRDTVLTRSAFTAIPQVASECQCILEAISERLILCSFTTIEDIDVQIVEKALHFDES